MLILKIVLLKVLIFKVINGADFTGAFLTGAIFSGCILTNTNFQDAIIKFVVGHALTGTPINLPTNWQLLNDPQTGAEPYMLYENNSLGKLNLNSNSYMQANINAAVCNILAERNYTGSFMLNIKSGSQKIYTLFNLENVFKQLKGVDLSLVEREPEYVFDELIIKHSRFDVKNFIGLGDSEFTVSFKSIQPGLYNIHSFDPDGISNTFVKWLDGIILYLDTNSTGDKLIFKSLSQTKLTAQHLENEPNKFGIHMGELDIRTVFLERKLQKKSFTIDAGDVIKTESVIPKIEKFAYDDVLDDIDVQYLPITTSNSMFLLELNLIRPQKNTKNMMVEARKRSMKD